MLWLLLPAVALAQQTPAAPCELADLRATYQEMAEAMDQGRHADAERLFSQADATLGCADRLVDATDLAHLFQAAGRAAWDAGDTTAARTRWQQAVSAQPREEFQRLLGTDLASEFRDVKREQLALARAEVVALSTVSVSGHPVAPRQTLEVVAGPHILQWALADDTVRTERTTLAPGSSTTFGLIPTDLTVDPTAAAGIGDCPPLVDCPDCGSSDGARRRPVWLLATGVVLSGLGSYALHTGVTGSYVSGANRSVESYNQDVLWTAGGAAALSLGAAGVGAWTVGLGAN